MTFGNLPKSSEFLVIRVSWTQQQNFISSVSNTLMKILKSIKSSVDAKASIGRSVIEKKNTWNSQAPTGSRRFASPGAIV